jgi:4-hydroxy-3-polyprenylbenzoate decarboxylase
VTSPRRLVIGITGATGAIYAVRMLQALRAQSDVETHLVGVGIGLFFIFANPFVG